MTSRSGRWVANGGASNHQVDEISHLDATLREMGHPGLERTGDAERHLAEAWARTLAEYRSEALAPVAESAQAALRALYPQELRPTPAFTVLRFRPRVGTLQERRTIPRGTLVACQPETEQGDSDSTTLRFTTTASFEIAPLQVLGSRRERAGDGGVLELSMRALEPGPASRVLPSVLRLFASHPHPEGAMALRSELLDPRTRVVVEWTESSGTARRRSLDGSSVLRGVGLDTRSSRCSPADSTSLLPWPSRADEAVRLLHELSAFPLKFAFVDLDLDRFEIERLAGDEAVVSLTVRFEGLRADGSGGELIPFCAPAVNLFRWEARPIRFGRGPTDHLITPESPLGPAGEVFAVEEVRSLDGTGTRIQPLELQTFSDPRYEVIRRTDALGTRCLLRIVGQERLRGSGVSVSLLCTDGSIAETHRVARLVSETLPEASVSSVAPISTSLPPRDREDAYWRLLSLLGGERGERLSLAGLRGEFEFAIPCEHLAATRLAVALSGLETDWHDRITGRSWIRCCRVQIEIDGSELTGPGEFGLLSDVLAAWVRSVVPINTVAETIVVDSRRGWRREGVATPDWAGATTDVR